MINSINTFKTKSVQNNNLEISSPLKNTYNTYKDILKYIRFFFRTYTIYK